MRWLMDLFRLDAFSISLMMILSVFSLTNILYSRSKLIRMLVHAIYKSGGEIAKIYSYRPQFLYFFIFILCLLACNNIIGVLSFESITSSVYVICILMGMNILLAICSGVYYKKYKAITDIFDPAMPMMVRILFAPLEIINLLVKIGLVGFRLFMISTISHDVIYELLCMCSISDSYVFQIIMFLIVLLVKLMHLFTGLIYPKIFTIQFAMLFGKFNEEHHHEI